MKPFLLVSGMMLTLSCLAPVPTFAQSDDFNDGNDNGWTRYDPLAAAGTPIGTWSFPDLNTYRVQTIPSPNLLFGPSRAGSLRNDVSYNDFYVSVDVVNWNNSLDQSFGILARLREIGLGTTDGYAMTYQVTDGNILIDAFENEDPEPGTPGTGVVPTVGNGDVTLVPGASYRFVFIGRSQELTAQVYQLPNLETPLASITGNNINYTAGACGLITFSEANAGTDVTFDNYFALDVEPPQLSITLSPFGDITVSWPTNARNFTLQGASILDPLSWTNLSGPYPVSGDQDQWLNTDTTVETVKFYRLIRP